MNQEHSNNIRPQSRFTGSVGGLIGNSILYMLLCIVPIVGWAIGTNRMIRWVLSNMTIDGMAMEFTGRWGRVFLKIFWCLIPIVGGFIFVKRVIGWAVENTHVCPIKN